ncbi:hypothetical protein DAA51_37370 [Bradyrhizobium sp. WBAH10]|nr:hypothetical protein [Bradyrhizobium sp. WBAH30]MDD1547553.1 hypothetical protein [Bradyrhizobium sp. WBAH41]MDD1561202.1 hypothetical protein [Bradyrhizobium sp. WBAH23]MDD1568675.1 hypothetical protein [Bradyrhizobium sp. WBAH33]MDD1594660.1 hypothetical protein [Bradyrhizobium sp. WBAH42]NRB92157.1 hypothetical protein [Bradyrhizobium sp. WBAH10]QCJ93604.1 hypothetical protein DAA57_38345 [Bradyrhizobium yuanmingense]
MRCGPPDVIQIAERGLAASARGKPAGHARPARREPGITQVMAMLQKIGTEQQRRSPRGPNSERSIEHTFMRFMR